MATKKKAGQVFGEAHGRALLTEKMVKTMRAEARKADKAGLPRPVGAWSERTGLSKGAISMAMSGETWSETPGAVGPAKKAAKSGVKKAAKKAVKKVAKKTVKTAPKKAAKKAAKKTTKKSARRA